MNLPFFSDMTVKGGGYLSIEDAMGSTTDTYLEDGFFDFLNEVFNQHCYDYDAPRLWYDFTRTLLYDHLGYVRFVETLCSGHSFQCKEFTQMICFELFGWLMHNNNRRRI